MMNLDVFFSHLVTRRVQRLVMTVLFPHAGHLGKPMAVSSGLPRDPHDLVQEAARLSTLLNS